MCLLEIYIVFSLNLSFVLLILLFVDTHTKHLDQDVRKLVAGVDLAKVIVLVVLLLRMGLRLLVMGLRSAMISGGRLAEAAPAVGDLQALGVAQVNYHHPSIVRVHLVSQSGLVAHLRYRRFYFCNSVGGMLPLADYDPQVRLVGADGRGYPGLQKQFGFFDVQPMEVDFVLGTVLVIFAENILGRLSVALFRLLECPV